MSLTERMSTFVREVRVEARKVTWPTRAELYESTMVVLVTVAIISMFIFVVDFGVGHLITWIL